LGLKAQGGALSSRQTTDRILRVSEVHTFLCVSLRFFYSLHIINEWILYAQILVVLCNLWVTINHKNLGWENLNWNGQLWAPTIALWLLWLFFAHQKCVRHVKPWKNKAFN
jgi:hypothetical protein